MRLATAVKYSENMQDAPIDKGVLRTPLKIDFHRSLLDTDACETFTEVIVTEAADSNGLPSRKNRPRTAA